MTSIRAKARPFIAVVAVAAALASSTPSMAAQADLDLIQSYVGDWRGSGSMTSAEGNTETVRCTLGVTRSTAEKINFRGRCALAGANLAMNGTMAYISASNRYEAVLTSNTTFSGNAIGRRSGRTITFNISGTDANGNPSNVRAGFGLSGDDISVDFTVTNADGSRIRAQVPFERE